MKHFPCRFCAGYEFKLNRELMLGTLWYSYECCQCGATTPTGEDPDEAYELAIQPLPYHVEEYYKD